MGSGKEKLPILDVPDVDERLKSLTQSAHRIQDGLVLLGLEYTNKVTGKFISPQNDNYFRLRDTIFFRLNSVIFHLRLLHAVQRNHIDRLNKSPYDSMERHRLLYAGLEEQVQLFDSIVFHSISLFDYLGNLIDYICNNKGQMKLKWNGVIRSINDSTNPLSLSPISSVVKQLHSDFVDRLYEHRSDLIHYSIDSGGAETTLNLMSAESTFTVFAPRRITGRFRELKELAEKHRLTLNYLAFWVADKTADGATKLIDPLLQHINQNRKTPQGSDIFFFGDPSKPKQEEPK